jgi:hypothetical protein
MSSPYRARRDSADTTSAASRAAPRAPSCPEFRLPRIRCEGPWHELSHLRLLRRRQPIPSAQQRNDIAGEAVNGPSQQSLAPQRSCVQSGPCGVSSNSPSSRAACISNSTPSRVLCHLGHVDCGHHGPGHAPHKLSDWQSNICFCFGSTGRKSSMTRDAPMRCK